MSPVHSRRRLMAIPLAVLASLTLATSVVAAPTWSPANTLRSADGVGLTDADFQQRSVAVAWDEPDAPRQVGLRTSVDAGSSFGPTFWFGHSRQAAVDICDETEVNLALALKVGPGNWVIEHHSMGIEGVGGSLSTPVAPGTGIQKHPDVTCAGGRVFVSWLEEGGSGDRLLVAHAPRNGGTFSAPIDLGFDSETFFGHSLALAGTDDMAYAAFARTGGDLRLRRWQLGGGSNADVTSLGEQVIAPGTRNDPADQAVIAAAGSKVAVAWFRCDAIYGRVSNDWGATWGPIRELVGHAACGGDFFASPSSIDIAGGKIAMTYDAGGIPNFFGTGLIRTNNDFATMRGDLIAEDDRAHLVGFVRVAGQNRLAAAFQPDNDRIRFRRQT